MARRNFKVTAVNLGKKKWLWDHPDVDFIQGDVFGLQLPKESFDLIINCSSVEHVGLKGRYDVKEEVPIGDIQAMSLLQRLLKPGKEMLLTIPVGRDKVFSSLHRVYGEQRLPRLLDGWEVVKNEYWGKDESNKWSMHDEREILNKEPNDHYYGLGLFVLKKPSKISEGHR